MGTTAIPTLKLQPIWQQTRTPDLQRHHCVRACVNHCSSCAISLESSSPRPQNPHALRADYARSFQAASRIILCRPPSSARRWNCNRDGRSAMFAGPGTHSTHTVACNYVTSCHKRPTSRAEARFGLYPLTTAPTADSLSTHTKIGRPLKTCGHMAKARGRGAISACPITCSEPATLPQLAAMLRGTVPPANSK